MQLTDIKYNELADPNDEQFYPWRDFSYGQPAHRDIAYFRLDDTWGNLQEYEGNWRELKKIGEGQASVWIAELTLGMDALGAAPSGISYLTTNRDVRAGQVLGWANEVRSLPICSANIRSEFRKPYLTVEQLNAKSL